MQDFPVVPGQRSEERPVTVHDDESVPLVALEELGQSLGVELVVAEVEGRVDGLCFFIAKESRQNGVCVRGAPRPSAVSSRRLP